ncbi:hypothetical protein HMPREF9969_0287 [Prevotella sp. oral taxon 306 str. F0472]|nr:hypothetical protein HMPREF9969_0287 [Prevotella sp. oral taxon 306 str. F0472]
MASLFLGKGSLLISQTASSLDDITAENKIIPRFTSRDNNNTNTK